jgi:hypothetical protein
MCVCVCVCVCEGEREREREKRNAYRTVMRNPYRKASLGKPKRRWRNIKLYLKRIECGDIDLIRLAENRTL